MFYFKLFESRKLADFSVSEKNKIINIAIKLFRKDFPLNVQKRLLILSAIVFIPCIILYFLLTLSIAITWLVLATIVLNVIMANAETPAIEKYLESAIQEFVEQK